MKLLFSTTCPVSGDRINGNAARAAAFYTILLTAFSLASGNYFISFLLAIDFGLRAFGPARFSLLRMLSVATVNLLRIDPVPADAAPKKFAAGLGMVFCLAIGTAEIFGQFFAAEIIGGMLLVCALLEGVFAFCLGCVVYTFLKQIFPAK